MNGAVCGGGIKCVCVCDSASGSEFSMFVMMHDGRRREEMQIE